MPRFVGRLSRLSCPTLLLLAACNSQPSDQKTRPAAAPTATAPAASPANSPGAWYGQYRGLLPGTTDSITLQLQTWPRLTNDTESAGVTACYSGPDGQAFQLNGDYGTRHAADSLILIDYNLEHQRSADEQNGPVWRLRRQGQRLTGTIDGQPVTLREAAPLGSMRLISRFYQDSVAAYPGKSRTPYAQASMLALQPVGLATGTLRDNMLRHLRGDTVETAAVGSLDDLWQHDLSTYTKDYREDAAGMKADPADSAETPSYALRYDQQSMMYVYWNQAPLLSIGYFTYVYSGGAHGNYGTRVVTYDTRTGRPLHYANIFRPDAKARLGALLDAAARRALRLAPTASLEGPLFVQHVPVTNNVFLTSGGATFVYAPYEIASFAQGEMRFFIPFAELRPLLQPELPVGGGADMAGI